MISLLFLPGLLSWGCGGSSSPSLPQGPASSAYSDQFDYLWQTFDQKYSYFVYKNIDWQGLSDTYRPTAIQATSQDQFMQTITQMLSNLHDLHVHLINSSGNLQQTYTPTYFINFNQTVWQQYIQAKGTGIQQTSEYTTGYLSGVAYFAIPAWDSSSGPQAADLDAALQPFQNTSALILDVRMNGGGDGATANSFAGRFADQTRIGGYDKFRDGSAHTDFGPLQSRSVSPRGAWQYHGPVYLLIGRGCYSSNEDFIVQMREYPNITVIGDTSGGHSGYPVTYPLSNGWQFSVSTWIDYTAEMQIIEDQGITPAIFVPTTAADFQAGTDPVLDYAISHLGG
ncbi:MAG: S41 family peptidase [Acidobacteriaceae bacterium]